MRGVRFEFLGIALLFFLFWAEHAFACVYLIDIPKSKRAADILKLIEEKNLPVRSVPVRYEKDETSIRRTIQQIQQERPVAIVIHYSSFSVNTQGYENRRFGVFLNGVFEKSEYKPTVLIYTLAAVNGPQVTREAGLSSQLPQNSGLVLAFPALFPKTIVAQLMKLAPHGGMANCKISN